MVLLLKIKVFKDFLDAVVDFLPSPVDIGEIKGVEPRDSDVELAESQI